MISPGNLMMAFKNALQRVRYLGRLCVLLGRIVAVEEVSVADYNAFRVLGEPSYNHKASDSIDTLSFFVGHNKGHVR
jgi:hypothetical protein